MVAHRQEPEEFTEVFSDNGTGIEVENVSSGEEIVDPFDPKLIRVDTRPMTIDLLCSRIDHKEINLAPGFQRKAGIWKDDAQSRLIESMLIRIPLPAFYIDATNDDEWLVIDGLQRLTTIRRFVIDKHLHLRGLEFLTQLEGKSYNDLPRNYQRRIAETQVTVYLIEKGTPDQVKFNIFKRINTGGLPLSAQEIRHALNQGPATQFLAQLADLEEFKKATDNSIRDERMADRECILRFLAFDAKSYSNYDKDLDNFLNNAMEYLNTSSHDRRNSLQNRFKRSMSAAYEIFGKDAFRKRFREDAPRQPINKALFESWSVNLSRLTDEELAVLITRKERVKSGFITLMNQSTHTFSDAISLGTGDPSKVRIRFQCIEQLIVNVLSMNER